MSNRILLPLAVLVGIIIGAVAIRPLPMANAQAKSPAAEPAKPAEAEKPVANWQYKIVTVATERDLNQMAGEVTN